MGAARARGGISAQLFRRENKRLKERMRTPAALEGVLAWAVQGAVQWYALGGAGLPELESSARLKQQQRGELDNVAAWVEECCNLGDHHFTPSSDLYSSYAQWCKDNGVPPAAKRLHGRVAAQGISGR